MLSNRTGATPAFALTWKPAPEPEKPTPPGELTLKKSAGRLLGAEKPSGTPSQLISRRPDACSPGVAPLFGLPSAERHWLTAPVMSPEPEIMTAAATEIVGKPRTNAINAAPPIRAHLADIMPSCRSLILNTSPRSPPA